MEDCDGGLFKRSRKGRQGGGVALYVREKLNRTALDIRDDVVKNLWVRTKEVDRKKDIVVAVY